MSDTVKTQVVSGNVQTEQSSQNQRLTSLRLISTKTHVGPAVKDSKGNKAMLTKAANRIRLNNDLKVAVATDSDKPKKSSNSGAQTLEIKLAPGKEAKTAIALMEAWDRLYQGKPGTPAYIEKTNKLNAVRSQVYESLGIKPPMKKTDPRPELTEEQRVYYTEQVKPYSFDYYEVRLSFKQPGHRAVKSLFYRCIEGPDLANIKNKLIQKAKLVISKFDIKTHVDAT